MWSSVFGFFRSAWCLQGSSTLILFQCFAPLPGQIILHDNGWATFCLSVHPLRDTRCGGAGLFILQVFHESIVAVSDKLTSCTLTLYKNIVQDLPPTPSKFHYIFNLRDLSRVYNGLVLTNPERWVSSYLTKRCLIGMIASPILLRQRSYQEMRCESMCLLITQCLFVYVKRRTESNAWLRLDASWASELKAGEAKRGRCEAKWTGVFNPEVGMLCQPLFSVLKVEFAQWSLSFIQLNCFQLPTGYILCVFGRS